MTLTDRDDECVQWEAKVKERDAEIANLKHALAARQKWENSAYTAFFKIDPSGRRTVPIALATLAQLLDTSYYPNCDMIIKDVIRICGEETPND